MTASNPELRLAIVDKERCKPKKCQLECKKVCPINRSGTKCIVVQQEGSCHISEFLCIGCSACAKQCPFKAINIVNLPRALDSETVHRFDRNGFKLHRLPYPRPGQVLGLVGQNGIGKSTTFQILSMKLRPNLGKLDPREQVEWTDIAKKFRGSELQNFFNQSIAGNIHVMVKPQSVDQLSRFSNEKIIDILKQRDQLNKLESIEQELELTHLRERKLSELSGGELQRFALAITAIHDSQAYFFDEPSSYLDIGQRMRSARIVRSCLTKGDQKNYVIVIEHDLAILDYMSDYISVLYGQPGAWGAISLPFSLHEGVNNFLRGEIPTENMKFRDEQLVFKIFDDDDLQNLEGESRNYSYPSMDLTLGSFHLHVEKGKFRQGEIIVILGRNGVGKTTFVRLLSRLQQPDRSDYEIPQLSVSYKPQSIKPHWEGTVKELFEKRIPTAINHPLFKDMVLNKLNLDVIIDRKVKKLSGGEVQRVAIALALGKNADIYLIDEPSAFLDAEQRIIIARIIKRYVLSTGKCAFVVEHDFIMASYLATRVMVFDGTPGVDTVARVPEKVFTGINTFLKQMDVTIRADKNTKRPRINKYLSNLDKDQKSKGQYYALDD